MKLQERYQTFIDYFSAAMPVAETELHYDSAFHLLIAVILSAQCTDKRVNSVTPQLFQRYPTPLSLAAATEDEVLEYIHSVSYPNSKARHLIGMAKRLVECFDSEIPMTLEALTSLPGVGRKTANVMMSVVAGMPTMAVDTHVFRVSHRIGLVNDKASTPLAVERALTKHLPADIIPKAHHWLILHGRYVCTAQHPHCEQCGIKKICKLY